MSTPKFAPPQKVPESRWDDLLGFYQQCNSMFGELLVYPQAIRGVENHLQGETRDRANKLLKSLEGDARTYKQELEAIYAQHSTLGEPKRGPVDNRTDGGDLFTYLQIATKYREWIDQFQSLMLLPVQELTNILAAAKSSNPTDSTPK